MRRQIIEIDREKCNGCGQCVAACAEGAIQMVDGKAEVVKDSYCDGLGACVGECPTGALVIVERDAPAYDPEAVAAHLERTRGPAGVARFLAQHAPHAHRPSPARHVHGPDGGCPGSRMRVPAPSPQAAPPVAAGGLPPKVNQSELGQWPIQLHLVPPSAPYFQGRELVIMSTCAPLASADVHWRFLRGRSVVVACPKLDYTEPYVEKLTGIFAENAIPKAYVVRMEVPCCGGLTGIARMAREASGRGDGLSLEEVTIGIDGSVREQIPV